MREIPVGKHGHVALVDDSDYEWLSQFVWYHSRRLGHAYRQWQKDLKRSTRTMHREIMGYPDGMDVDHVDGNRLNNQRANLRVCTHEQNTRNVRGWRRRAGRYKGVYSAAAINKSKPWVAFVCYSRKQINLGYFATEEEGARAYDDAARALHGGFACLNFPRSGERSALTGELAA